jgi:hypothetical protein
MSVSHAVTTQSAAPIVLPAQFDYCELSSSVAKFLRGQAERIRRQATSSLISIGKDLIAAKQHLSHGAFLAWVESEVGMPARTAQAYMRVAKWASGKGATVAQLPPSLLHLFSTSGTPESYITDVLKRVEAGERVSLRVIRDELRDLRETRQDERQAPTGMARPYMRRQKKSEAVSHDHDTGDTGLDEVVAILARGLCLSDFTRVREIMTARSVLDDPELPRQIVKAFLAVEKSNGDDHADDHASDS